MSNMRIRNMFLLVTALAVMFLLACGSSEYDKAIDDLTKAKNIRDPDEETNKILGKSSFLGV